ncbi:MAG: MFS transporter [Clostridia bacterium]|nr:MFS transporter [Clostridia bacterium]
MNQQIIKARKQNMKIYSLYRTISLDLIFYYAVEFLFLTQVKHISSSDIVLSTAFYGIFMIVLQIPASIIIDKIGTKKCTILANIFNSIFVILIMCCNNLKTLIFAQFISALCFSLKDISEAALIKYSIPETKKEGEIFSKLEGKGFKHYYLLNSITSVISGFLYICNPYIPMILALCFTILATFMSLGFKDIEKEKQKVMIKKEKIKKQTISDYFKDLVQGVKFIINSQRLRSLFLYSGIAWGIFCLMGTYRTSLLVDIGTPEQLITTIAAIVGIASAIGSKEQIEFHNIFRNKSLSMILLLTTFSIIISGIVGIFNINYGISMVIIIISFSIISFVKGISGVLSSRYLSNFSNEKIITQIYAVNAISRNVFRAIIGFLGSYLLRITNTANSTLLVGIILLITTLGIISYMKTRLGLKPEEYDEREIYKTK